MDLNNSKTTLLVGCLTLTMLSYSPQVGATGGNTVYAVTQQARKITGKVTDGKDAIIGATVKQKGTNNATITDLDGNFTLSVPQGCTLEVSYIGYASKDVKISAQNSYVITLSEDNATLNEVVVVGYGSMKKSDVSGASVTMDEKKLRGSIVTSLDQTLQGRAAGVTAVSTSGAPGTSTSIRVRGQATINANAEPLYVIDGVIVQGSGSSGSSFGLGDALGNGKVSTISPLSTINPNDIVSMEILKDASATAIYGAQGANGVVLITTRRGKAGEAKFTYDGMMAVSRQNRRLDVMDLREFADYYNDFVTTGQINSSTADPHFADPSLLGKGTNWQDAIFRTALMHSHQIAAQGGSDKVQYYVSANYMNQQGTIIGSNFDRLGMRVNLDAKLKSWLKLGLSANFSTTHDDLKLADSDDGIINYSLTTPPDIPIYNIDGSYSSVSKEGFTNPNPIAMAMLNQIKLDRRKLNGNFFFEITPIKNLVWHAELGYDLSENRGRRFLPTVDLGSWKRKINAASVQKGTGTFWQLKNYVTYSNSIGKHNLSAMLGQEMWESTYDNNRTENTNLPSNAVNNPALGTGTPAIQVGFGSSAMSSVFTRLTYAFNDRYNATYTYRYDGSSNFGPNKRWAGFHSFAASWRFTNESFFQKSVLSKYVSNGKLRAGWGQTGNSAIGSYKWGTLMKAMPTLLGKSYRPDNIPNLDIQWESQEQWNIGLDLGLLNDRVNITLDWYRKESKDMLMPLQLPSYMGTSGNVSSVLAPPYGNYGTICNTGVELTVNTHPITGRFQWDSEFQISWNKNKLVALSGTKNAAIVGYGQWSDVISVSNVGESLYGFYGFVTDGVYKDLKDLELSPKTSKYPADGKSFERNTTPWVGDLKFKDISGPDGKPDGKIDDYDKMNIGSPMPKFTFGWTNTFRYKNFDLNVFINGTYGNKVYNYMKMKLTHMNTLWSNQLKDVTGRARLEAINPSKTYAAGSYWYTDISNVRVANPGTSIPRATITDPNDNDVISDRYIEDGSYIRFKNIALGYTLPKKWISKWGFENIRVSMNIQNLFTITKYDGYDPEIGASTADINGYTYGVDNGRYPSPTTYSFGLNLTF